MYVATVRFADLEDEKRIYEAGEAFPRPGLNVTKERIAYLAGSDNRMGYPLIREEKPVEPPEEPPKETVTRTTKDAKKAIRSPKRGVKRD